jgi:hypothetical protein
LLFLVPNEAVKIFYMHREEELYDIYRVPNLAYKNPMHVLCQNLLQTYQRMNPNGQHVKNLMSELDFITDLDLVLRQIGVSTLVKQVW